MFETADLAREVDKATWKAEEPGLRQALLAAQIELRKQGRFPVLVVVAGVDGAGKSETVHLLNEWMDPRFIGTHGFDPRDEDRGRPGTWRFWRDLPPKGRLGIFYGAWHSQPILDFAFGRASEAGFERSVLRVQRFEQMLAREGVLLVKFWLHLTKQQQKDRLEHLASRKSTRWRVGEDEWKLFDNYDALASVSQRFVQATSSGEAPWYVVNGLDARYRGLTVGRTLLEAMQGRLETRDAAAPGAASPLPSPVDGHNLLRELDLTQSLDAAKYERQLEKWQRKLALLSRSRRFRKHSVVVVFEGNDAAGKGGAIRRVTAALDARYVHSIPVAAPSDEEREQPYLWRFWRHLPRRGSMAIFDRSWYGRVLVERVEGFCSEADWMRAYQEINDFESELDEAGTIVVKFWLAISKDEQLRRFEERQATPHKRFKITDEDWRNREKWDLYEQAVCDMIDRTSTEDARWTVVEANDKRFARVKVLKTLVHAIEQGLEKRG